MFSSQIREASPELLWNICAAYWFFSSEHWFLFSQPQRRHQKVSILVSSAFIRYSQNLLEIGTIIWFVLVDQRRRWGYHKEVKLISGSLEGGTEAQTCESAPEQMSLYLCGNSSLPNLLIQYHESCRLSVSVSCLVCKLNGNQNLPSAQS